MLYTFIFSFVGFVLCCFGASVVFFLKTDNNKTDAFLHSFASGVMIASSIFSLIIPAVDYCNDLNLKDYIILPLCFIFACIVFLFLDYLNKENSKCEINKKMLVVGVALHNIPEGMSIGFAFASVCVAGAGASIMPAIMIALGIGIQNIPEGSAVSFPLYSSGVSKKNAFWISALAGFLEVPSAIIAYLIGTNIIGILPFMLTFSGASMIIVATVDLMPEATAKSKKIALFSMIMGFTLMMLLDLSLG